MNCYLDSSVILRLILGAPQALRSMPQFKKVGASELVSIECNRVIDRYRLENLLDDRTLTAAKKALTAMIDGMHIIELTAPIKRRAAESFPTVIGTLDALHLASALLWRDHGGDSVTMATHDRQLACGAAALQFPVIGSD